MAYYQPLGSTLSECHLTGLLQLLSCIHGQGGAFNLKRSDRVARLNQAQLLKPFNILQR